MAEPPATVDPRRARQQPQPQPADPVAAPPPADLDPSSTPSTEPTPGDTAPAHNLAEPTQPGALAAAVAPGEASEVNAPSTSDPTPAPLPSTAAAAADEASEALPGASSDLDAAIQATLAAVEPTSTDPAPAPPPPAEPSSTADAAGSATPTTTAPAEQVARTATSTPALYETEPSSSTVPSVDPSSLPSTTAPAAAAAAAATAQPSTATTTTKPAQPTSTKPTSSLSRIAQLQQAIERDPLDGQAQLALLKEVESKGDLDRTRATYEEFLKVFPDASDQWISYCDLELAHSNFSLVESLFSRCLRTSTSLPLWKFYLSYIRRINPIDRTNQDVAKQTRQVVAGAFEFALDHVGMDRRAGEVWSEYIEFLKEAPTRGTWEEQQKMDQLRKAYQRAVQIPVNNVEQIWQDYNAFENGVSKMTAKKFIAELSPSYMTARKCLRELRAQHDALYHPILPSPPDWSSPQATTALQGWKRYLAFEEMNPLELDDPNAVLGRVSFAYRKALSCLRFYPEIWYLSANYNMRMGRVEEAKGQLQAGLAAIPSSLLLAYTLADLEESKPDHAACYAIYDNLISHLYGQLDKLDKIVKEETDQALEALDDPSKADGTAGGAGAEDTEMVKGENGEEDKKQLENGGQAEEDDDDAAGAAEKREKRAELEEKTKNEVKARYEPEIERFKRMAASVWITEMRFARRADGVKPARQIFTKARKSPHLSWQVVEASATMEMYWNEEPKIATNVFELGLKLFAAVPEYVLKYLEFLLQQNNANNARALFERTVSVIEPAKAKGIWDRMAQYEYEYGDHLAAQKMFQRYSETFFDVPTPVRFASKYAYPGLEDSFLQDLGPQVSYLLPASASARGRSTSPRRLGRSKRGLSPSNGDGVATGGEGEVEGDGSKRMRRGPSPSPAPSSQAGSAFGNVPPQQPQQGGGGGNFGRGGGGPRVPEVAPALNRAVPFMLDPRGDNIAVLPDAVVFFLGLLPPASAFTGPQLNPVTIMDIISSTILPGSAPGPGLPGERLGIPPRPKPERGGDGGRTGYGGSARRPLSPQRGPPGGGMGQSFSGPPGGGGGGGYGYGRRY
ncbi:hypothetical protein JCM10212_004381 [Sporobolomyces blumeae]